MKCVLEMLEKTCRQYPDKEAVEDITFKKTGQDVMMEPKAMIVTDKLNNELVNEKARNETLGLNGKVLLRKMKNE